MLKRFEIQNFKNFLKPLSIDFSNVGGYQFNTSCICHDYIGKIIVYGRNGTGKTNLGAAILDIALPSIILLNSGGDNFLNADSDSDCAKFLYVFQFGTDEIQYQYEKYSMAHYKSERLTYNGIEVFHFDYSKDNYTIGSLELVSAETIHVNRFLELKSEEDIEDGENENTISFLKWIFANTVISNNSSFGELRSFINRMRMATIDGLNRNRLSPLRRRDAFFESLEGENLNKLEKFLNDMGVECKLKTKKLPDGQVQLYFRHKKLIPFFDNASSGTRVLFNLYYRVVTSLQNMSFCYFDEFDAFFHYEMSERFLNYIKETFPNCQVVFTTHNTNLMSNEIMRPDCLFILSRQGMLTPLNKATNRELREGHNLEKMYISGEFDKYE